MSSLNSVELIGNLGQDPEIKTFADGNRIANVSIATSDRWKDKRTGEQREKTEWHRVVIKNEGLVGVVEKFCRKGSKVFVRGRLETRKWQDQSGQDRYSTEVVLPPFDSKLVLLSSRSDGSESGSSAPGPSAGYGGAQPGPGLDDEIPF